MLINSLFYLTRKCNLNCIYCRVKDNFFPNELKMEKKMEALSIMKYDLGINFVILFGGEPLELGENLETLIVYCNSIGMEYAITSNSVMLTEEKAKRLTLIGLKNWSVSIDGSDCNSGAIKSKSSKGFKDLLMFKEMGVLDLHATLTLTKNNIDYVIPILEELNKHNIWMEITALHFSKGHYYDFASPREEMKSLVLTEEDIPKVQSLMEELKKKKQEGFKIHNEIEFFDEFTHYCLEQNWRCKTISNITIDADGKMRTCLHYNRKSDFTIFDLKNKVNFTKFLEEQEIEITHCRGCFWDCRWQAEYWQNNPDEGKRIFQHK